MWWRRESGDEPSRGAGTGGADATAGSGERLASVEVGAALGARVRRGRRRRTLDGAGAAAGVAVVAIGLWAWLPLGGGARDMGPAGPGEATPTPEASRDIATSDVTPVDTGGLRCGAEGRLEEGSIWFDKGASAAGASAESQALLDDGSIVDTPSSLWVGYEAHQFAVAVEAGAGVTYTAYPLLFRGDEIVGRGMPVVVDGGSGVVVTPTPGDCGTFGDWVSGGDGTFTPRLLVEATFANGEVGAQFVVSAGDMDYTGMGEWEGGVRDADLEGLATVSSVTLTGGFTCDATLDAARVTADASSEAEAAGGTAGPVPSTLETGRLYGYGDDALVGGYPAPLGADAVLAVEEFGGEPARLVLSAGDSRWVFDAAWSERDDLPHDEPGWFVELNQVWDCGSPNLIEPGVYEARLIYSGADGDQVGTAVLSEVTVVGGVPSIPEVEGDN